MTKGFSTMCFTALLLTACNFGTNKKMNTNPVRTFTLKPGAKQGKDAFASSFNGDKNYGFHEEFSMFGWTNGGTPSTARQFIEFEISHLAPNTVVHYAEICLFNSPYTRNGLRNGEHVGLDSLEGGIVSRILEPWDEDELTWNNMPETDDDLFLTFPPPEDLHDNLRIDVTDLVREMVKDPENSHGFAFRLQNENHYRALILGSSDCPDSTLWPQLKVSFQDGM